MRLELEVDEGGRIVRAGRGDVRSGSRLRIAAAVGDGTAAAIRAEELTSAGQ